jgi:hypothetical protein
MPWSLKKKLNAVLLITTVFFIFFIVLIKVQDSDFWWHVKAGEVFRSQGWIQMEPFAHTREGEPYLATQSWLADIVLSVLYDIGGFTGVILLRMVLAVLTFLCIVWIDPRRIWPNAFLIMFAAVSLRHNFVDRPQLWTFFCFAAALFCTTKLLEKAPLLLWLVALMMIQILWSNMHGGASLVIFALLGAVIIQRLRNEGWTKDVLLLSLGGLALCMAFFATPNGIHNIRYVFLLFTDQTGEFIQEWRAPNTREYVQLILIGVSVLATTLWSRFRPIASMIILCAFLALAMTGVRHIPLFMLASVGIVILQLKHNPKWKELLDAASQKKLTIGVTTMLLVAGICALYESDRRMLARDQLFGFGAYEPLAGAYEYVEKENLQGNMFNTYEIGGYLLFRGYPHRKIFVDGRNIDHGYEILRQTFSAAQDPETWKDIEEKYDISYAIISYLPSEQLWKRYPYTYHLDANPAWSLVYLDEYAAVYEKNTSRGEYTILTPENFHKMSVFDDREQEQIYRLEQELLFQATQAPESVNSLLLLAQLYHASKYFKEAAAVLAEAEKRQPQREEVHTFKEKFGA